MDRAQFDWTERRPFPSRLLVARGAEAVVRDSTFLSTADELERTLCSFEPGMNPGHSSDRPMLASLVGGDGSSFALDGPARAGAQISRCDRGSVSILVMFMGLVMFALVALVWNTGEVTTAKIESQTAADSAAYSGAVWTSRALNITAATNAQILRDASAAAVTSGMYGQAVFWLAQAGPVLKIDTLKLKAALARVAQELQLSAATFGANFATLAAALIQAVQAGIEFGQSANDLRIAIEIIADLGGVIQPAADIVQLTTHMHALVEYQRAWLRAIPLLIEQQREDLEKYYDCDIILSHPDGHTLDSASGPVGEASGLIRPPLRAGRTGDIFMPLAIRYLYDLYGKNGRLNTGWAHDERLKQFENIKVKPFPSSFRVAAAASFLAYLLGLHGNFHTLTSAESLDGPFPLPGLEYGPFGGAGTGGARWPDFTVLAVASKRTTNEQSLQMPARPLGLMAQSVFGVPDDVRPVAYATAETFNGIDGFLGSVEINGFKIFQELGPVLPWRMWTDWGWQWTARLSHSDALFGGDAAEAFRLQGYEVERGLLEAAVH